MKEEGIALWRRHLMWLGVRLFGWSFFEKPKKWNKSKYEKFIDI